MKKSFTAHQNLIRQVIERQAGTLSKALMEATMNSIDAGAKEISIGFLGEPTGGKITKVLIRDDGRGFRSKKEIDQCFGTFGQPHEMEGHTSIDARYGTFRIGRGQMFAYGTNRWRSGRYLIEVNIRDGLDYVVTKKEDRFKGTQIEIELFSPFSVYDYNWQRSSLEVLIKFTPVPVKIELLGVPDTRPDWKEPTIISPPEDSYWTYQEDGFQYRAELELNSLDVYCDGMFVESIPTSQCGLRGHLNAPKGLKLNTARNQVIRDCPLWQKMITTIQDLALSLYESRKTFLPSEVEAFWRGVKNWGLSGYKLVAFLKSRSLIPVSDGSYINGKTLTKWFKNNGRFHTRNQEKMAFLVQTGANLADTALQFNKALPLDDRLEDWIGQEAVQDILPIGVRLKEPEDVKKLIDHHDPTTIDPSEWTAWEKRFVVIAGRIGPFDGRRVIQIGHYPGRHAWTDGRTYITCDRQWVKSLQSMTMVKITELVLVILHEYAHNDDSLNVAHDLVFYREYHELTMDCAPNEIARLHASAVASRRSKKKNQYEQHTNP